MVASPIFDHDYDSGNHVSSELEGESDEDDEEDENEQRGDEEDGDSSGDAKVIEVRRRPAFQQTTGNAQSCKRKIERRRYYTYDQCKGDFAPDSNDNKSCVYHPGMCPSLLCHKQLEDTHAF